MARALIAAGSKLGVGLAPALVCTFAGEAVAQQFAASETAFETIVVTAQKRKEDVKEVPLSVSAISGEALQDNQIVDFTDLSRIVPNLSFMSQAGPGLSTLEIRGVTSQAGSATVGLYLDDVSLTTRNLYSQGVAEPKFFDISRVEVLRGPQGTLYGAGSEGGTIRFVSNLPDPAAFSSNALAQVSHTQHGGFNYLGQGVVNVPLTSSTAVRVGLQAGHDSGYIDQLSPTTLRVVQNGINGANWTVERLTLMSKIDSDWSITPSVFAQQYRSNDIDAAYLFLPSYQVGNGQTGNNGPPLGLFQTSKIVREPGDDHLTVLSLTANGDLHFGDLTTIVSNYKRNFVRVQDGTFVNSNFIACQLQISCGGSTGVSPGNAAFNASSGLINTVNGLPSAVDLQNTINSTSAEMRLASKDYQAGQVPLTWIAGLYYARTKTDVTDYEPVFGINAAFQGAYGNTTAIGDPTVLGGAYPNDFPSDSSYYSARHYYDRQKAVFGELTTHLFNDSLRLITGLRWTGATETFNREGAWYFSGFAAITPIPQITSDSAAFTPRFAVDWDIDPTTTAYVNVAKGYRVGGANRPIPQQFLTLGGFVEPASFRPDSLWSYELGTKSRLLDRRLSFNTAVYWIEWSNIQQDVTGVPGGYDFETNLGRASSKGIEVEAAYRITHGLTALLGGNWTRAVFTQSVAALQETSGEWIQGVPKYMAHVGLEDHFPVSPDLNGVVRVNGNWTGSSYGTWYVTNPDFHRPQYFTSDLSAGLLYGRFEVNAFIKNLNNNHTVIQQMPIQFLSEAVYLRPRTIGIWITGQF
jgi:iron complex outermembrane recepter protein